MLQSITNLWILKLAVKTISRYGLGYLVNQDRIVGRGAELPDQNSYFFCESFRDLSFVN
jgi:hypothetical protein